MAGIGEGFMQGLALGQGWKQKKKDREMQEARMTLDALKVDKEIQAQKDLYQTKLNRDAESQKSEQTFRREMQDRELGARSSMQDRALQAAGDQAAMDQIGRSADGFRKFVAAQQPSPPPMGRVKRLVDPYDEKAGEVTYDVPLSQLPKPAASPREPRVSPYANDIGDAEKELAKQQAELAAGDKRTMFGLSRAGIAQEQTDRLFRLKALDLQDKVAKGHMSREEAAAEAERIKKAYGR